MKFLSTKGVALVGVFAALHAILYYISFDLWRSWVIYLEPVEGIVLGPWVGALAALLGGTAARIIKPIDVWMFGIIAEPLGVLAAGFLSRGQFKPVMVIYASMLGSYFVSSLGRQLPIWTILDILLALVLIYPASKASVNLLHENVKRLPIPLIFISFIGAVADSLTRVFLLVPIGLYSFFGWSPEIVSAVFIAGAIDSYIEDVLVIIVAVLVGLPLLIILRKIPALRQFTL